MKRWQIVYALPLEVWVEIFSYPWISHEEFGQIVDIIGNFKFAEHAQFYLHEWGKQKLGGIHIDKKGFHKFVDEKRRFNLDVPQTPLPPNIKSFEYIRIRHSDARTMDFLDKIRPLFTELDLKLIADPTRLMELRTVCTHLAPLLGGIHSLHCADFSFPMIRQCFSREQLAQCNVLTIDFPIEKATIDPIVDWLIQPEREDNTNDGPKLCEAYFSYHDYYGQTNPKQIYAAIREQFLSAKSPSTFAVNLHTWRLTGFRLENRIGEEMHGKWIDEPSASEKWGRFQITRHRPNCGAELQDWIGANTTLGSRGRIETENATVGSLAAAAAQVDVQPVDEEQNIQQQPSCLSKEDA